jgi:hypothetical protein
MEQKTWNAVQLRLCSSRPIHVLLLICVVSLDSIGMKIGAAMSLGCFLVLRIISDVNSINQDRAVDRRATAFYRCVAMLLLLGWLWGCAIWVWTKWRINYVYIFGIDRYGIG